MIYHCGHKGCDICGGRTCREGGIILQHFGSLVVCSDCVGLSVRITYDLSCRLGGTILDAAKPCGHQKEVPA